MDEQATPVAYSKERKALQLRQAFDAVTIPEGRRGQVVFVATKDGANLGAAWVTKRGWTVSSSLSGAVRAGKAADVTLRVGIAW